jgi:hypothetical protein
MSASRKIAQQNINDSRVLMISLFLRGDNLRNDAEDVKDDCEWDGIVEERFNYGRSNERFCEWKIDTELGVMVGKLLNE